MCLTLRPPGELAPPGSYVEHQELRRVLIDAHHVELKGARGARHAGNLLILCRLHHNNYGRQLTRSGVSHALRDAVDACEITFPGGRLIEGYRITLPIEQSGETVRCFFTAEHRAYWLENA